MKNMIFVTMLIFCFRLVSAEDLSEKNAFKSPLKVFSCGLGLGSVISINDELKSSSEQFLTVTIANSVYLQDHISLFIDANWFAPGSNFAATTGFDFFMTSSGFRPFVGLGAGIQYYDKSGDIGENVGPAGTVHAGFLLDLTDRVQVRFRVPYYVVGNNDRDHAAGFEFGFLFSGRFKNVKKLNYN